MKFLKYFLLVILLLLVIFFGRGLLTPHIEYDSQITVAKSASEAWAVMGDETKLSQWLKGFIKTELVSGTANTVGAVSNIYVEDNGQEMIMKETITAFEPGKHMGMNFSIDFMDMDYKLLFSENDDKTQIKTTTRTMGNGLFAKSMISFMQGSMKSQEDENLKNLKKLIEENTTDYFSETTNELIEVK